MQKKSFKDICYDSLRQTFDAFSYKHSIIDGFIRKTLLFRVKNGIEQEMVTDITVKLKK